MPIQDLVREDVVTCAQDTSITELAELLRDENVGSVVVTDGATPIGIVTDRDLAIRVLAEEADPNALTAANVMSTDLCVVGPDAGFYQAAEVMAQNGIRRLPVCTEDDELAGIITADDLGELLADEQQQMAAIIRAQRPEY
jgi:CBS domain-containing protein